MPITRADRLFAIVQRLAPAAAAHYTATGGQWPPRDDSKPARFMRRNDQGAWDIDPSLTAADMAADPTEIAQAFGVAPYEIRPTATGGVQIRVTVADGDVVSGTGPTMDAAIAALETKAEA
jgi:hypothetical protein